LALVTSTIEVLQFNRKLSKYKHFSGLGDSFIWMKQ
jgi:hypothetical protein